ncbi:MAG TPA: metallophosphoesterase [Blastocatellia bacterium]|jgi:predicted phosphodiesterase
MEKKNSGLVLTRREAVLSLATITAGTLIKPTTIFGAEPSLSKTRFAVVGDWGTGDDDQVGVGKQMLAAHQQSAFDFVLAAGDNIYPNGAGRHFVKKFEQPFAGLIKDQVKFYAVLGNHDVQEGRQDQTQYPLFNMGGANYYMFHRGNGLVDFFMIDSTDFDATQQNWLENSLRDSRAKWKVACFHHPLYSSGKKHGSDEKLRKRLEHMLVRYGVQVVFSGHDHFYERTKPQQGIQYFVTGAGGKTRRGGVDKDSPILAASYDADNQFMTIEVSEKEIEFKAISETGETIDSGVIRQQQI